MNDFISYNMVNGNIAEIKQTRKKNFWWPSESSENRNSQKKE